MFRIRSSILLIFFCCNKLWFLIKFWFMWQFLFLFIFLSSFLFPSMTLLSGQNTELTPTIKGRISTIYMGKYCPVFLFCFIKVTNVYYSNSGADLGKADWPGWLPIGGAVGTPYLLALYKRIIRNKLLYRCKRQVQVLINHIKGALIIW